MSGAKWWFPYRFAVTYPPSSHVPAVNLHDARLHEYRDVRTTLQCAEPHDYDIR